MHCISMRAGIKPPRRDFKQTHTVSNIVRVGALAPPSATKATKYQFSWLMGHNGNHHSKFRIDEFTAVLVEGA
jgi:hypothetical protein